MYPDVIQEKSNLMDSTMQAEMTTKSREAQQEEYLAFLLLQQSSNACFSELKTKLANKVLVGGKNFTVIYPTTLNGMARLLRGHKNLVSNHGGGRQNNNNNKFTGVAFVETKKEQRG